MATLTNLTSTGRSSSTAYNWDDSVMTWDGNGDWDAGQSGNELTNLSVHATTLNNLTAN